MTLTVDGLIICIVIMGIGNLVGLIILGVNLLDKIDRHIMSVDFLIDKYDEEKKKGALNGS